ncbi:unnamed protein product [Phyllotreta striolata]|uniref:Uncharacterized protein n=1 Tax=Phyllotreta striolata TaxID=444603 RepID=A0A9N9TIK4_PHYSR|nr:unnamed protein product [Phyllotreta striolata]
MDGRDQGEIYGKFSNMQPYFLCSKSPIFPFSSASIKRNACTQTDSRSANLEELLSPDDDELIMTEKSRSLYLLALRYVNKFHRVINEELKFVYGNRKEAFMCPSVPNYSALLCNELAIEPRQCKNEDIIDSDGVYVHLKIQENSQLVRRNSFNVVAIEPCVDILEYARSKEKLKSPYPPQKPPPPPFEIRPYTPQKIKSMFDAISQKSKVSSTVDDSDDSVILDDEQFEQHVQYKNPSAIDDFFHRKSNPLQLNSKDLTNLNERTLHTIGLFNNKGEIKPDVMDLLEKEKSFKAKDARNKQFRSKRQWDLQIHLNPKSDLDRDTVSSTSQKSFVSYSDVKIHMQNID